MAVAQVKQTAAEIIRSGGIEQYASYFHYCRDHFSGRNCGDYAKNRLYRDYPLSATGSVEAVARYARAAVNRGSNFQRGGPGYMGGDFTTIDPVELLRDKFGVAPIGYRYRVRAQVTWTFNNGPAEVHTYPVIFTSSSPLSKMEIEARAEQALNAAPQALFNPYLKRGQRVVNRRFTYEIQSATRTRLY